MHFDALCCLVELCDIKRDAQLLTKDGTIDERPEEDIDPLE